MRHVAAERVKQVERVVAVGAADVHMLAEHRELLAEVAVERGDLLEARLLEDPAVSPLLERMRAAAGDADVEPRTGANERVADVRQLSAESGVVLLHARRDLEHALRDLRGDGARERSPPEQVEHVGALGREVEVAETDELQFELDTHRERIGLGERFERHLRPPGCRAVPVRRAAHVRGGSAPASRPRAPPPRAGRAGRADRSRVRRPVRAPRSRSPTSARARRR